MKTNNQHSYPSWLVPVEIAKQLKEIGFDKPCIFSYSEGIGVTACLRSGAGDEPYFSDFVVGGNSPGSPYVDLPAWGQVFGWFREKGFHGVVEYEGSGVFTFRYIIMGTPSVTSSRKKYYSYNEAREQLLINLIKVYKIGCSKSH